MLYLVIALHHNIHGDERASPVFASDTLAKAVMAARKAGKGTAFNINGHSAGINIYQIEPERLYTDTDFLSSGTPAPEYPCLCHFYKEDRVWKELWHHEKWKKRFAEKQPARKRRTRAR